MTAVQSRKRAPPIEDDNPRILEQLIVANAEFLRLLRQQYVQTYMERRYRAPDPT
jgi:hypothetical protein